MNLTKSIYRLSCLRKSAFICGWLFVLLLGPSALAQRGGKAEPNRIEFKPGTTSTTIGDVVHGDEQAEYVFSAQKGQRLTIKLTATPAKSACFDLKGPDDFDGYTPGPEYSKRTRNRRILRFASRPERGR